MVDQFAMGVGQSCGMGWNEKREKRFTRRKEERRNKVMIERDKIVRWLKA